MSGRRDAVVAAASEVGESEAAGVRIVCERWREGEDVSWSCMTTASPGLENRRWHCSPEGSAQRRRGKAQLRRCELTVSRPFS